MTYTFTIIGGKGDTIDAAISAPNQQEAIRQLPAYSKYFAPQEIEQIIFTGKY